MPFRFSIAVACGCCGNICQSGGRRSNGHLYTVVVQIWTMLLQFATELSKVSSIILVTSCKYSWQLLSWCCLSLYLLSNCLGIQIPTLPPLPTVANAAVAYKWHIQSGKIFLCNNYWLAEREVLGISQINIKIVKYIFYLVKQLSLLSSISKDLSSSL